MVDHLSARARTAVLATFAANGSIFAALASRLPDIKSDLHLSAGALGTVLLVGMLGSLVGLPVSGRLNHRLGMARSVRIGACVQLVAYLCAAAALAFNHSATLFAAALFVGAIGMGVWDVSMNLEGAEVERAVGRTIMPWFHAAFSGGTVVSAIVGAGASALRVEPALHLVVATAIGVGIAWSSARNFLPHAIRSAEQTSQSGAAGSAWSERRTVLIGVMVLVAALTEGTANDWIAVALHEGYDLPAWAGVLGFAVFLSAMTLGRVAGALMIDRFGRVLVLRVLFMAAALGSVLVVFGGPWLAYVGAAVWGIGASLGFPVGMSAAADDPARAAARVSVVSTVGYVAFLVGPPMLGFLGDHVGVLHALLVVGAAAGVALLVVPAARPLPEAACADTADAPHPAP